MKWEAYIELQWKYNAPCNYRILLISDKMIMQIEMLKTLKQFVSNLLSRNRINNLGKTTTLIYSIVVHMINVALRWSTKRVVCRNEREVSLQTHRIYISQHTPCTEQTKRVTILFFFRANYRRPHSPSFTVPQINSASFLFSRTIMIYKIRDFSNVTEFLMTFIKLNFDKYK